MMVEWSETFVR